jgi:hypothetical protein
VGPLPESEGSKYLFTIVDRFSRWPEAIPVPDSTAITCARALLRGWIARFGVPDDLVSDRGSQFTSSIWAELAQMLGINSRNTCAYRPQANGLVERLHRQLKGALKAKLAKTDWMDHLPLVMLGVRTAWREGLDASPAELLYGTTLRLPGEFIGASQDSIVPSSDFLLGLQSSMRVLTPKTPQLPEDRPVHLPADLATCTHVYIRHDAVKKPLQRPYDGPFRVLEREAKYFLLNQNGRQNRVSLDRLKPAFIAAALPRDLIDHDPLGPDPEPDLEPELDEEDALIPGPPGPLLAPLVPAPQPRVQAQPPPVQTRSGRIVRPPNRLDL